jgi:hypothetical protein
MNENLVKEYESGKDIRTIAKEIGKSYEATRQLLKSQNVVWHRKYIRDLTQESIDDILMKFDSGITITEISLQYKISEPAIARLLRTNNRNPIGNNKKYEILRSIPINQEQKDLIYGTVLGDGCLYKDSKNGNFKLSFGQCEKQKDYFLWKVQKLDPYINNWRRSVDKRGNSIMYQTTTICHPELNSIANYFYDKNRKKHIPNDIDNFLTPIGLAVWIMDDGWLSAKTSIGIATMGFNYDENVILQNALKNVFDIDSKVVQHKYKTKLYYKIVLNKENTIKASEISKPYVVDCMKYKFIL